MTGLSRSEKLPRIEDALWIEGVFECVVCGERDFADRLFEPAFFGEADAMFAGDGAAVFKHPGKELIEGAVGLLSSTRFIVVCDHQVGVDVAIAGMTETGDGYASVALEFLREGDELDQL